MYYKVTEGSISEQAQRLPRKAQKQVLIQKYSKVRDEGGNVIERLPGEKELQMAQVRVDESNMGEFGWQKATYAEDPVFDPETHELQENPPSLVGGQVTITRTAVPLSPEQLDANEEAAFQVPFRKLIKYLAEKEGRSPRDVLRDIRNV